MTRILQLLALLGGAGAVENARKACAEREHDLDDLAGALSRVAAAPGHVPGEDGRPSAA